MLLLSHKFCNGKKHNLIDNRLPPPAGLRYNSPKDTRKSRPRFRIFRITSSNPDDPDSPFYDETSAPMHQVRVSQIIQTTARKINHYLFFPVIKFRKNNLQPNLAVFILHLRLNDESLPKYTGIVLCYGMITCVIIRFCRSPACT